MPEPTPAPRAVFLSHAREDTDAARRIAEALRSQGVEVWPNSAGSPGGEAGEETGQKQIRECTLFLPVVSARTSAQPEGEFRRDWTLAVERSREVAAGVAFVVPVAIDDTTANQAVVPEEFKRGQWTRLPGALPTPEFVTLVKNLLVGRKKPSLAPMPVTQTAAPMRTRPPMTPLPAVAPKPAAPAAEAAPGPAKKTGRRTLVWVVLLLVLGGAAAGFVILR